jgi:hypothetical protein
MKLFLPIGIVALTAAQLASAAPLQCERWEAPGTDCELLGRPPGCTVSGRDKWAVNAKRYTFSAYQACKNYVNAIAPGKAFKIDIPGNGDPAIMDCFWDQDGDGIIGTSPKEEIMEQVLTPEPQCFCKPHGPYKGLPWSGNMTIGEQTLVTMTHVVPKELKKAVLLKNLQNNGGLYVTDADNDLYHLLQKINIHWNDAAEIDHIIPRTDSQGCICGDPTPENLAVISRELNGMMSNLSPNVDANRAKMFEQFVDCDDPNTAKYQGDYLGPPPLPVSVEAIDTDESTMDVDLDDKDPPPVKREATASDPQTAGCAVGGGGGALGLGLAFLFVRRRRRGAQRGVRACPRV